jgi:hypothetical protein
MFPQNSGDRERAKKICAECPVQLDCATWALQELNRGEYLTGVYGGMMVAEIKIDARPGTVSFSDRICEWEPCENPIPDRGSPKGGNLQRFCCVNCRRSEQKRRAALRDIQQKIIRKSA